MNAGATVENTLYVAELPPSTKMRLLDLTHLIDDGNTEFESLGIALFFLFLAEKHAYEICRTLAIPQTEQVMTASFILLTSVTSAMALYRLTPFLDFFAKISKFFRIMRLLYTFRMLFFLGDR